MIFVYQISDMKNNKSRRGKTGQRRRICREKEVTVVADVITRHSKRKPIIWAERTSQESAVEGSEYRRTHKRVLSAVCKPQADNYRG